ncbi:hypothetical protein [Stenotrophomonas forensis]|uniref:hypothetical protein n=1 Tax=Stenotrophomonas forensis TaxID=2871169 RepID=UPI0018D41E04|nr:hypothetical protein [Stenotrophomonas maltophilia]MBH1600877.1 hypothetical protein [Stenotrophomonas maltophilia]
MNHIRNGAVVLVVALGLAACGKSPDERAADAAQQAPASQAPAAAAAPAAANPVAQKYEGKVVRRPASDGSKEDGWFYVEQGQRHWIVDANWLQVKNLKPEDVIEITAEELSQIPESPDALGGAAANPSN